MVMVMVMAQRVASTFYTPSKLCEPWGMHRQIIWCSLLWWKEFSRYDTVLVSMDADKLGMEGMVVARVRAFLSFAYGEDFDIMRCALVEWFILDADEPDSVTGMWVVHHNLYDNGAPVVDIIPISSIVCVCHLAPVYSTTHISPTFLFSDALDAFRKYFVNWYIDQHLHKTLC
ncbi:hypothetical protein C8Q76DRAFT_782020 [Earliella scabrosa]|nr:hypothetical protein C8Q76DRAFT_782020 [Earliella scabrosa]